jgi:hypothetical protein
MAKILRITSRTHGFRRCGVAHPSKAVDHPLGKFTEQQIELLKAEPELVVQEMDVPDKPKGKGKEPSAA